MERPPPPAARPEVERDYFLPFFMIFIQPPDS